MSQIKGDSLKKEVSLNDIMDVIMSIREENAMREITSDDIVTVIRRWREEHVRWREECSRKLEKCSNYEERRACHDVHRRQLQEQALRREAFRIKLEMSRVQQQEVIASSDASIAASESCSSSGSDGYGSDSYGVDECEGDDVSIDIQINSSIKDEDSVDIGMAGNETAVISFNLIDEKSGNDGGDASLDTLDFDSELVEHAAWLKGAAAGFIRSCRLESNDDCDCKGKYVCVESRFGESDSIGDVNGGELSDSDNDCDNPYSDCYLQKLHSCNYEHDETYERHLDEIHDAQSTTSQLQIFDDLACVGGYEEEIPDYMFEYDDSYDNYDYD